MRVTKPEDHIEKAREIERSIHKLNKETDWALIVEGTYNASFQYIAYYCEMKYHRHNDTHTKIIGFLNDLEENEMGALFSELSILRVGRWYGSKKNGDSAKQSLKILERIKETSCNV